MRPSPPNILLIQVDQLTAGALSCYGGPADTPNLDRLATESVVFDSAYANFPLCAPSRFSMLSGRLPSEIGAYDNAAEFPASIPTFAHYLRAAGYHTALVGKMHFIGPDQLHGYDERLTTDLYPSTFVWTFDPDAGHEEFANDLRAFTSAGPVLRNPQLDFDEEVAHQAHAKLFDLARRRGLSDGQPWHVTVSFTHPHPPYQCRPEFWDRYSDDDIPLPRVPTITTTEADPYSLRLRNEVGLLDEGLTDDQIRTARHAYYGSISHIDERVGQLLRTLHETGLDTNTVVVFTSDHGDMLGERGLWYKKVFFEPGCRVPLFIRMPERFEPRRVNANVSLVDLLPTFTDLGWTGAPPEPVDPLDGASLVRLLEAGEDSARADVVYGELLSENTRSPIVMVKRGGMKFVTGGGDPDQLYDVATDADEIRNLAADPDFAGVRDGLAAVAADRWDLDELDELVLTSRRRRLFLRRLGDPAWGYEPPNVASGRVLRDGTRYNEWNYGGSLGRL